MIDPSVREDGELEPSLELEGAGAPTSQPEVGSAASEEPPLARGANLRERLIERAAQAPRQAADDQDASFADLDEIGLTETETAAAPEVIPSGARAPSAPFPLGGRDRLTPNQHALFTTLLGVATVSSLIALAMNIDIKSPSDTAAPASSNGAPPSVGSAAAKAPEAPPPKKVRQKVPGPWRIEDAKGDARLRIVEREVGTEAFLNALEKVGVEQRERYRILTSMKGVRDFDRCKRTDKFRVLLERGSGRVKAFEFIAGPAEIYQSRESSDGLLKGTKLDLKVEQNQVTGAFIYDGQSFDASAERVGFESGLRRVVAKALDGHLDMGEIERGDRLRVIAQEQTVLGDFGSYLGIEALELRPADSTRSGLRIYYFDRAGERGYYDLDGRAPYEGGWRKPIKDAPMTSPFNMKRMHPVLKRVMPHTGVDFGSPTGTPVGASSFGTVSFIGYSGPSGNLVKIEHSGGIETGYAHLSRFAEGLKVGDRVKRMQVVGYVGSTGRSTGPHLHFTATRNGEFFDPITLRLDAMRVVSKEARAEFAAVKAKYDAILDAMPLPDPYPAPAVAAPASPAPASAAVVHASAAREATAEDPSLEAADEGEEPTATVRTQPPRAAAPEPPQPSEATPSSPATTAGKSMVHLTDKELLQLSGMADDGEVAE